MWSLLAYLRYFLKQEILLFPPFETHLPQHTFHGISLEILENRKDVVLCCLFYFCIPHFYLSIVKRNDNDGYPLSQYLLVFSMNPFWSKLPTKDISNQRI